MHTGLSTRGLENTFRSLHPTKPAVSRLVGDEGTLLDHIFYDAPDSADFSPVASGIIIEHGMPSDHYIVVTDFVSQGPPRVPLAAVHKGAPRWRTFLEPRVAADKAKDLDEQARLDAELEEVRIAWPRRRGCWREK